MTEMEGYEGAENMPYEGDGDYTPATVKRCECGREYVTWMEETKCGVCLGYGWGDEADSSDPKQKRKQSPMTVEEIDAAIHAKPFRPLWVFTTDGDKIPVISQEVVFLAKADESLIIVKEQGGLHILDVGLIARVEPQV